MKARHRLGDWPSGRAAVLMAVWIGIPGTAVAAGGGAIQITGMIVAPLFDIYQGGGAPQMPVLTVSSDRENTAAHAVTVTYAVEPNSAPVADVSLVAAAETRSENRATVPVSVDARFTDGAGHTLKTNRSGAYHLSGSGGVLSLVPRNGSASSGATLVTVVTRYQ